MRKFNKNFFTIFLAIAVFLATGCKSIPDLVGSSDSNLSPEAKALEEQAEEFNLTVGQGALIGGVVGGVIGLIAGDNKKAAATGAAIGAAGGAALGYYIAGEKQEFANREEALNALSEQLTANNTKLTNMVETSEKLLAADKKKVQNLLQQIEDGKAEQANRESLVAQLRKEREIIVKAIEIGNKQFESAQNNLNSFEKEYGSEGKQKLESLLAEYQDRQSVLNSIDKNMQELIKQTQGSV